MLVTGAFYFTLGNLPPKYRSRLSSIHLLALVKSSFISQYGMDAIMKPFIQDLKKLVKYSNCTCSFLCLFHMHRKREHGAPKIVYGTLAILSADNLGSLAVGGFKESCGALKICRHCMATKDASQKKVWLKHIKINYLYQFK